MSRRFAGAGLMRRSARSPVAVTGGPTEASVLAELVTALGAGNTPWLYEARADTVTLAGSLVSQQNDAGNLAGGPYHAVQTVDGERPTWDATGAPNGLPCISMARIGDHLLNTAISVAAGARIATYAVCSVPTSGAAIVPFSARIGDGTSNQVAGFQGGANFLAVAKPNGGAQQAITITTPAADTDFHVVSNHYLASGLECRIDGVLTDPQYTGNAAADAVESLWIGRITQFAGGKLAWFGGFLNPDGAQDALVRAHLLARYGL